MTTARGCVGHGVYDRKPKPPHEPFALARVDPSGGLGLFYAVTLRCIGRKVRGTAGPCDALARPVAAEMA